MITTKNILQTSAAIVLSTLTTVALATPTYSYSLDSASLGGPTSISELSYASSIQDFYGYGSPSGASANPPLDITRSNAGVLFLYEDSLTDTMSLGVILDAVNDGSGYNVGLDFTGLPTTSNWVVRDDPGDSAYTISPTGISTINWLGFNCCTDGGALSNLDDQIWDIDITLNPSSTGISDWYFVSGNSAGLNWTSISSADMLEGITLSSSIQAVPAPAAWTLMGGALLLLGAQRRRKTIQNQDS